MFEDRRPGLHMDPLVSALSRGGLNELLAKASVAWNAHVLNSAALHLHHALPTDA